MKRVGFQFRVRSDRLDEYKERHQSVWPEMLQALRAAGWRNYTLFARPDGLIFGYFESEDSLQTALARMAATEVNTRWQAFMAEFNVSVEPLDDTFVELEEYFHLD